MKKLEDIRRIVKNYPYLQGLRCIPIGVFWCFLGLKNLWPPNPNTSNFFVWVFVELFLLIAAIGAFFWLGRYYNRHFGKVNPNSSARLFDVLLVAGFLLFYFVVTGVDLLIDYWINVPISLQGLAWALFFGFIGFYLKRSHYYIEAIVLAAASILPTLGIIEKALLFDSVQGIIGFVLVGLTLIIAGILDHFFLVKNLTPMMES